jgi:hypothetical protein
VPSFEHTLPSCRNLAEPLSPVTSHVSRSDTSAQRMGHEEPKRPRHRKPNPKFLEEGEEGDAKALRKALGPEVYARNFGVRALPPLRSIPCSLARGAPSAVGSRTHGLSVP